MAQPHPLETLITAARENSRRLGELLAGGMPGLAGRDGAAVWGQDFLFAVRAEMHATPMDVPLDFVAELELDSAKMKISKL